MLDFFETYFPLKFRIPFGLSVFLMLAIIDFKKYGWKSERLREYAFLIYCVGLAVFYGIINDFVTSKISPEYFIIGKGIKSGDDFDARVAWLAVQGSYWVGLLLGIILLVANNRYKDYPRLSILRLKFYPILPFLFAIFLSIMMYFYGHESLQDDATGLKDATSFYAVMNIHKGAYLGSLIGGILAILILALKRIRLKADEVVRN